MFQFEIKKDILLKFIKLCPHIRNHNYEGIILKVNEAGFASLITTSGYILIIQKVGMGDGIGSCRILYEDLKQLEKTLKMNTEILNILRICYDNDILKIYEVINNQIPDSKPIWQLMGPKPEYDYNSVLDKLHKKSELEIVPSDLKKIFRDLKTEIGNDWKKSIIEIYSDITNGLIGQVGEITKNICRDGFYKKNTMNNAFRYKSVMFFLEPFLKLMGRKHQLRLIGYENGFISMEFNDLMVINTGSY